MLLSEGKFGLSGNIHKVFSYKLIEISFSFYTISAYEKFHQNDLFFYFFKGNLNLVFSELFSLLYFFKFPEEHVLLMKILLSAGGHLKIKKRFYIFPLSLEGVFIFSALDYQDVFFITQNTHSKLSHKILLQSEFLQTEYNIKKFTADIFK